MTTLSVIIITKNESENIRKCLESVKFADEIVVIDSISTDGTQKICLEYTNKVYEEEFFGYGPQKQKALDKATSEWVLCLDADEVVTENLKDEIKQIISSKNNNYFAYDIPFHSIFCGKLIKFGDWSKKRHTRLFKRNKGKLSGDNVHCKIIFDGKLGHLDNPVIHDTWRTIDQAIEKMNIYSTFGSIKIIKENKKGGIFIGLAHAFLSFFKGYFLKAGFLDGKEGYIIALINAQTSFYKYVKADFYKRK